MQSSINMWSIVNSLGIFALTTVVTIYLRRAAKTASDRDALTERLFKMDAQLAVLGTQVSPLWAAVQSKIAKDLTHPSVQFHEMDELLRRLEALTITPKERQRLHDLLIERTTSVDPEVSEAEKESAKLMIGVMDKVLKEAEVENPMGEIQLIMLPPDEKERKTK